MGGGVRRPARHPDGPARGRGGLPGLAALVQVCATLPRNYIAFEYPIGQPAWWCDIVRGLPDPIVTDGFIEVWNRPGLGVEFNVQAARISRTVTTISSTNTGAVADKDIQRAAPLSEERAMRAYHLS